MEFPPSSCFLLAGYDSTGKKHHAHFSASKLAAKARF
jgi:hypothetical protein